MRDFLWRGIVLLWRRPGHSLGLGLGIFSAVVLVLVMLLVARNVHHYASQVGRAFHLLVYLEDPVDPVVASSLAKRIARLGTVERVEYVSPSQALGRLRESLGEDPLFANVDSGLLPGSLEITLAGGIRDLTSAHSLVAQLEGTSGVADVEFLEDWADKLAGVSAGSRAIVLFLLVLIVVLAGAVVLAISWLSSQPPTRDFYQLFGASSWYERGPEIWRSVVLAGLATSLAVGVVRLGRPVWHQGIKQLADALSLTASTQSISGQEIGLVAIAAMAITAVGSAWPRRQPAARLF